MLSPFTIFVILIVVFAVTFVGMAVKSVPQGSNLCPKDTSGPSSDSVDMSVRSSLVLLF